MTTANFGRLERVDLRAAWNNEAGDFTPWLAQEENLVLLGDAIGIQLDWEATEKSVGPFRADIVCKDTLNDTWVLIENQLERTDHTHLGQLITYAAGLDAVTIVWVAARITEEHRAALDWLNEITDEAVNFFGLEVELWRIADSPVAPKFNLVSKPNAWTKTVVAGRRQLDREMTPTDALQLEFWQGFVEFLEQTGGKLKMRAPKAHYALATGIGRSGYQLDARAYFVYGGRKIGVQLDIQPRDAEAAYDALFAQKDAIEAEIGAALEWNKVPGQIRNTIGLYNVSFDPNLREQWPDQYEWLKEYLEAFRNSFGRRVRAPGFSERTEPAGNPSV